MRKKYGSINKRNKIIYNKFNQKTSSIRNREIKQETGQSRGEIKKTPTRRKRIEKKVPIFVQQTPTTNNLTPCQRERRSIRRDYFSFINSNPPRLSGGGSSNRFNLSKRCK